MDKLFAASNITLISRSFFAVVGREIKRFSRYWLQTLVSPILTTLLYFIVFGKFLGNNLPEIDGVTYVQFIAPGLIMMAIIYNAYLNVASSFYGAKFQKYIEEIIVSPLPDSFLVLAFVIGGVARGIILAVLFGISTVLIVHIPIHNLFLSIVVISAISLLFSLLVFINGLIAERYEAINFILVFIITPFSFLGGVFYTTDMLPIGWSWINYANPIFYLINMFRYAVIGVADGAIVYALIMTAILILVLYIISVYLVRTGIGLKQ